MSKIGISEAFRKLGATLKNVRWSVSAINKNGELVVSLWGHHRDKSVKGKLAFKDRFDRWSGPGNNEFRRNVTSTYKNGTNLRLVIVATDEVKLVEAGVDASTVKKCFWPRGELVGKVVAIDGENYSIEFEAG